MLYQLGREVNKIAFCFCFGFRLTKSTWFITLINDTLILQVALFRCSPNNRLLECVIQ